MERHVIFNQTDTVDWFWEALRNFDAHVKGYVFLRAQKLTLWTMQSLKHKTARLNKTIFLKIPLILRIMIYVSSYEENVILH